MNIVKIATVLKKTPMIIVYQGEQKQFISNGFAMYDISELPTLYSTDQVYAILGISPDKYQVRIDALPIDIMASENDESVEPIAYEIKRINGERFRIFKNENAIIVIKQLFLKPLDDDEIYSYFLRRSKAGEKILVVNYGILGDIMCVMEYKLKERQFFDDYEQILRLADRD